MRQDIAEEIRKTTRALLNSCWEESILRPPKRKPSEWAEQERWMPIGGPISGGQVVRYEHRYMPHCIEQMDAADDPDVRIIALMEGIREGKTNGVGLNLIGRTCTDDPGGIYCIQPTILDVDKFSADDINPLVDLCPSLDALFVKKKSRDSGRTKDFLKYIGGSIRIPSAGSITSFRASTVKMLLASELDAYRALGAQESIHKAINRTTGVPGAIILLESTPTYAPTENEKGEKHYNSAIHEFYEKGDMRKWFCECASCGHLQWLKYAQFKWPPGHMEHARYHCEECDHPHDETEWRKMASEGRWFPTSGLTDDQLANIAENAHLARAKQPEVRSYWRNGFTSLLPKSKGYTTKLHQFVAEGEAAKSSPEALKTWTNEIAAELWDANLFGEPPPDWKPLKDRAEDYATEENIIVPRGGLVLCGGGDVHPNRIEWSWIAFGRNEEAWPLDHEVIDGDTRDHSKNGPWATLKRRLQREFTHELGGKMTLEIGMIDAGYGSDDVLLFLQTVPAAGKLRACRGASTYTPAVVSGYTQIAKGKRGQATLMGHFVGTDVIKDKIYARLRMVPNESGLPDGWIHFAKRLPDSYYEQLCSERVTVEIVGGKELRRYTNEARARNETLDTFGYAYASFRRRNNWDFEDLERQLSESSQVEEEEESRRREFTPMVGGRGGMGRGWSV